MSRFYGATAASITPYTPGEQPRDKTYTKLNTNECPYPPAPGVHRVLAEYDTSQLRLYPDPTNTALRAAMGAYYSLPPARVFAGGGSDEVLAFAFMAFFTSGDPVYFPDITYGFYKVYADLFGLTTHTIPLDEEFSVQCSAYYALDGNLFLANPNAPTGKVLAPSEIEEILKNNPDRLVVIDEAYADFSPGSSMVPYIDTYDNLLVVQTFSKSRSLAGMRIGFAFGQEPLIEGLERMRFSFNPFNIDPLSSAVGIESIREDKYFKETVQTITTTRENTRQTLLALGYEVLPSEANFLFARHPVHSGQVLYQYLRANGVLIRYFAGVRTGEYIRITIGTPEEMLRLTNALAAFKEETI